MVGILIITRAETQLPKPGARRFGRDYECGHRDPRTRALVDGLHGSRSLEDGHCNRTGRHVGARYGVAFRLMEIPVGRFIIMPRMAGCSLDVVDVLGGLFC